MRCSALGNEAIGCGSGTEVCSCGYFLAFLGDAKRRASEGTTCTLTTGQSQRDKKGKITTHGMMDLLRSTLLKIMVHLR